MKNLLFTLLAIFSIQPIFSQTVFETEGKYGLKDEIDNSIILKAEYDQIIGDGEAWILCKFNPKYKGANPKQLHDSEKIKAKLDNDKLSVWNLIEFAPEKKIFSFLPNMRYGFLQDISEKPIPAEFEAVQFIFPTEEFLVKKEGSYYQYNPFKRKLSKKTRADKLNLVDSEFFIFERDGKWGMMEYDFSTEIDPKYDSVKFIDDLRAFQFFRNGEFQFLDKYDRGKLRPTEPLQAFRTKNSDGFERMLLAKQNGNWGLLDIYADLWSIKPTYEELRFSASKDNFFAKKEGKWGIIGLEGNQIIPFQYEDMEEAFDNMFYVKENGKYGLFALDGEEIYDQWNIKFDSLKRESGYHLVFNNGSVGLYDSFAGQLLLPISFDEINVPEPVEDKMSSEEGLVVSQKWIEVKKDGKTGVYEMSVAGEIKEIIPPNYDTWRDISDTNQSGISQLNWFLLKKNGKWGIFKKGSEIEEIRFEYDSIHPEVNDGILTAKKDGKWGLISKDGSEIHLKFIYDEILPNPHFSTYLMKYKGKWGKQTVGFDDNLDFFEGDFEQKINVIEVVPFEYTLEEAKKMEKAPDMKVKLDGTFDLLMESNASTNFKWYWLNEDSVSIVELTNQKYTESADGAFGSSGTETWDFKAIKKGIQAIEFGYTRPGGVLGADMQKRRFVIMVE